MTRKADSVPGGPTGPNSAYLKRGRKPNATVTGSAFPAADYGKSHAKGDGRGRAIHTQEWAQEKIAEGDIAGGMASNQTGTSIFDPVLCELAYRWFCPLGGLVLDPFAGGSVRGIVAAQLGRQYLGIDLSARQLAANRTQAERICQGAFKPEWQEGDSRDIEAHAAGRMADFLFSCPPYADLEIYSDDPRDLSTLEYPAFREAYRLIINAAATLLKPDRFACFVVGEARDRRGNYYGLVPDTIDAFRMAGLNFYNEAILVTQAGSLPIRAARQFESTRKLGKTHQNVLIFVKGDPRKATAAVGAVEFGESAGPGEEGESGDDEEGGAPGEPEPGTVDGERVAVRISAKTMRLEFNGCQPDFIRDTCHGRCCWIEGNPKGTTIHVEPDQVEPLRALGAEIDDSNIIVTKNRRCTFQSGEGFCSVHASGHKPRSCIQSPFMLTERDTLIIRNRYKALPCYRAEPRLPVYRAFASGLQLLFGADEAARITAHLDAGGGDLTAWMDRTRYAFNKEVRDIWNSQRPEKAARPGPADSELSALTPVIQAGACWLKRDNVFEWQGAHGAKARAGFLIARGAFGLVTAGARHSRQVLALAQVCRALGIPCRAHVPAGEPGAELIEAQAAGAEIIPHSPGYNTVIEARARDDARQRGFVLAPIGMPLEAVVALAAAQAAETPAAVRRIVCAVGSGTNLAAIVRGLTADIPILAVQCGADPAGNLDRLAPGWRGRVTIVKAATAYGKPQPASFGGIGLDPVYEAKCVPFLEPGDMLWCV